MSTRHTFNSSHLRSIGVRRPLRAMLRIALQAGRPNFGRLFVTLIGLLWFAVLTLRATDRYVTPPGGYGTNNPPYTSWADAATNIQWAVDVATNNDIVWVTNGSYCVTNQIAITNRITVKSVNGYSNTLVYADWPNYTNVRCFYVSRTGVVDGFTISNGHYIGSSTYDGGGGALLAGGTILNCYFIQNICSNGGNYSGGGGVYMYNNSYGNGTISNCIFVSNTVYKGGSGSQQGGGAIGLGDNGTIIGCRIDGNNAPDGNGGGIGCLLASGSLPYTLISNCTFNANSALSSQALLTKEYAVVTDSVITNHKSGNANVVSCAGSILRNCLIANNKTGFATISLTYGGSASNCTIAGNESTRTDALGGAVQLSFADTSYPVSVLDSCVISNNLCAAGIGGGGVGMTNNQILRNCLIHNNTNNSASGRGGGVLSANAAITRTNSGIINCTIVNNYSKGEGGGICAMGPSNYIVNCVIAGNTSFSNNYPNVFHKDNFDANKSNYYYSCVITTDANLLAAGQGNITNDPVFAGAGNWRLNANSPCVNTGSNQNWMANSFDLDGRGRIRYGTVDIGAYETMYVGTIFSTR